MQLISIGGHQWINIEHWKGLSRSKFQTLSLFNSLSEHVLQPLLSRLKKQSWDVFDL